MNGVVITGNRVTAREMISREGKVEIVEDISSFTIPRMRTWNYNRAYDEWF